MWIFCLYIYNNLYFNNGDNVFISWEILCPFFNCLDYFILSASENIQMLNKSTDQIQNHSFNKQ